MLDSSIEHEYVCKIYILGIIIIGVSLVMKAV
jgi:hypothetical protein